MNKINVLSFKPKISKSLLNPELAVNFPVKSVDKSTGKNYISWPRYRFRNRFAGRENWRISWKIPPPGSSGRHRSRRERLRHLHRNRSRTRCFSSSARHEKKIARKKYILPVSAFRVASKKEFVTCGQTRPACPTTQCQEITIWKAQMSLTHRLIIHYSFSRRNCYYTF